jgi:hypothetical protein
MRNTAIKTFEIEEGSTEGMHYRITVRDGSRTVKVYERPTMREAQQAFEQDGYKLVAWAEGPRVVLRGE